MIFAAVIFAAVFFLLGRFWAVFYAFAFINLLKAAFFMYFFRDPARNVIIDDGVVLSPADGTVFDIVQSGDEKTIRIFLSVFNVHLQRSPVAGTIKNIEHKIGKFYPAMRPDAHIFNKQNIITIETPKGEIFKVHQIVGILARRLVLWVKSNQPINQGDKIGMIKFGSQVDISMPKNYTITVKPKDKVFGGLTVLAKRIGHS